MIVGIDAREARTPAFEQAPGLAGRGRYVNELLRHLPRVDPDTRFLLYSDGLRPAEGLPANVVWRPVGRGARWHVEAARAAARECDTFLSLSYITSNLLREYVQTVFDLIAFRGGGMAPAKSRRVEGLTLRRAVRRARAVLTISDATAADLVALVPEAAGKTTVTPLAADARFVPDPPEPEVRRVRERLELPPAYVLATGTIEPRKNYARLMRAHAALPDDLRRAHPLVIAGGKGWDYGPILAEAAAATDPPARLLGFVPDEDLAVLYAGATAFCYPSLYEGFGLPVLEAMQAGAPVVTSNVSSLPEVGGDAVLYVDPEDETALRDALTALLGDERRRHELSAAGLDRARLFTWERTARATMQALRAAQGEA